MDRSWRRKLNEFIKDKEQQIEVYAVIKKSSKWDHRKYISKILATNLLPKNVGNWSPAEISAKEILGAYDPNIPEDIRQLHKSECLRWKWRWDKVHNPPATIVEILPHCRSQEFPNLSRAFTALLTLPVTTATAERFFSALRRLKTYLRSTMEENRLNGLHLCISINMMCHWMLKTSLMILQPSGNRRIEVLF